MAPSPEHDKEPKAPDKTTVQTSDNDSNDLQLTNSDQQANLDTKTVTSGNNADIEENAQIETLDDGQLRALLDEAITYKRPKDREGKSLLFKELLEEAEQDEEAGAEVWRRRGGGGRSGSLQELAAAARFAEPPRRRAPAAPSAAARAHHGGSLPSGVDTHTDGHRHPFLFSEEVCGGRSAGAPADYIATVHCVNPPPLAERRVSVCEPPNDEDQGTEMDIITRTGKLPHIHMMYTARATHDIVNTVPSIGSGRAHTTTTSSSQIDSGISFGCITTPAVVASCITSTSIPHNTTPIDPKPLQLASSYCSVKSITGLDSVESSSGGKCSAVGGVRDGKEGGSKAGGAAVATCSATQSAAPIQIGSLGTTHRSVVNIQHRSVIAMGGLASLSRSQYSAGANSASTSNDDYKKSLDENGNALQSFSAGSSGSQHKKRRKKWTRNETVAMSEQIDGYQGHKDLSELLRFIESDRAPPPRQSKQRDEPDDRSAKKRSIERRAKDKVEAKMKKASSMEELSCTKLEDLTDDATNEESLSLRKTKKHSTGDSADAEPRKSDRRSWGNDSRDTFFATELDDRHPTSPTRTNPPPVTPVQSAKIEKKKIKQNKALDASPETAIIAEATPPVESLEFQTVTKKKRTRKRHSPYDENRSRNGNNNGYGACSKECTPRTGTRFAPAVLSAHDRDILYNKFRTPGSPEHRRKSASSVPPSDKSNDSNDDLDSVHSLPVESTAEKMSLQQVSASSGGTPQASYADIARFSGPHVPCPALASPPTVTVDVPVTPPSAAVVSILNVSKNADKWPCVSKISLANPSSPPTCADLPNGLVAAGVKSPPAVPPTTNSLRGHNIPDLIESCNFYTNDTPSKCPVDVENSKNAFTKETVSRTESLPADFPRTKNVKNKITEADSTADSANNSVYNMENYPALDSKNQKNNTLKPKIDKKTQSKALVSQPPVAAKQIDKKIKPVVVNKAGWKENNNVETNHTSGAGEKEVMTLDNFSSFVKVAVTNMDSKADVNYEKSQNLNVNKMAGLLHNKLDGIVSKPPDVVMPLTEMTHDAIRLQPIECRPAVIILNEEIKKSTENVSDIDGITFGFDINEQLLNGEIVSDPNLTMLLETPVKLDSEDLRNDNAGMTILYNSNIEFPAINEKPHRENRSRNANDEYSKHSKKSTRNYKDISKSAAVGNSDSDNNNECKANCGSLKDKVRTESVTESVSNLSEQNNKCDLVKDAALKLVSLPNVEIVEAKVGNDVSLRYLAPAAGPKEVYNLDKIVHYVGMAWEDIMKCPGSKVHYFNDNQ